MRLRAPRGALSAAAVRLWDDRVNQEQLLPMQRANSTGADEWWELSLPPAPWTTVWYYFFVLSPSPACGGGTRYYVDDDPARAGGGPGVLIERYDDWRSFQITVYDPGVLAPDWAKRAVVYQVFPDRFRDGDARNNPGPRSLYGRPSLFRSGGTDWNTPLCDPRGTGPGACPGAFGENFYGGDLAGITAAIQDGYFNSLGVTALYLNPIHEARSNHRYDAVDLSALDPALGTWDDWDDLVAAANARGLALLLDGVFNHVSAASPYFDRASEHAALGACEDAASPYRSWFVMPGRERVAQDGGEAARCAGGVSYESFGGYAHLPRLNPASAGVRSLIFGWPGGAALSWLGRGASGFRLDAAGDLDPGVTGDPANSFWEDFRRAVHEHPGPSGRAPWLVGESWGDAAPWLLGAEWDGFTNYRVRGALLGWGASGCAGEGCAGNAFSDNDNHARSHEGPIAPLSPSGLHQRLLSLWEDTPREALYASLNLLGTHDTNRLFSLLRLTHRGDAGAAREALRGLWLFLFSYPGAPMIYYGDELALDAPGVWHGGSYEDDPYNRAPFPWGAPVDEEMIGALRWAASVRQGYRALQDGEIDHGAILDDARGLYGFWRRATSGDALVLLNRGAATTARVVTALPEGATLLDAARGVSYLVRDGAVEVEVPPGATLLLEPRGRDVPVAPVVSREDSAGMARLSWDPVYQDEAGAPELAIAYEIHRGPPGFRPSAKSLRATIGLPAAPGALGPRLVWSDSDVAPGASYAVIARTATGATSAPGVAVLRTSPR